MPAHNDSVDKIIQRYLSAVTTESFTYKKRTYEPKPVKVSARIFVRKMTCVAKCGACCSKFTLDYVPCEVNDNNEEFLTPRLVDFNGRTVEVFTDLQEENKEKTCRFLDMENGRCGIHGFHPFSCDFEPIRFYEFQGKEPNRIDHRPFGRAWNMTRIDGEKGALCEWYEENCDEEWKQELIRKFKRLKDWADHFRIKTVLPGIIDWIRTGPHNRDLLVGSQEKKGFEVWME